MIIEDFRTLYVDPGEDTGWAIGRGELLLGAGTTKMWEFADAVWDILNNPNNLEAALATGPDWAYLRDNIDPEMNDGPIQRIVCEDFRIYPWKCKDLKFDPVRTARLIGALTFMARLIDIPIVFQGATIKERAVAGGAEELFYRPLHENRHQNDAIMHFVYYTQAELKMLDLQSKNS